MFRQLGIGACFALTAAAIAVGCGSKGSTIFGSSSSEVNDPNSSMGALQQADQSDHAGLSDNNTTAQNFTPFQIKFNQKRVDCDGAQTSADGSAMLIFSVADNNAGNIGHFMAAQWNGNTFAGPQELLGPDQDETIQVNDARFPSATAAVCVPLNGAPLNTAAGGAGTSAFAGGWVILWSCETASHSPALDIPDATTNGGGLSLGAADAAGAHQQLVMTAFLAANRNQPDSVTQLIGNTATSGAPSGPVAELKFGFQARGARVNTEVGGASPTLFGGGPAAAGYNTRPASDVVSFGAASDTFQHCATFGSTVADPTGVTLGSATIGPANGGKGVAGVTLNQSVTAAGVTTVTYAGDPLGAGPGPATYQVGDNTTFVQIFWTQLVTSHAGANTTTFNVSNGGPGTIQLGPQYLFWTGNLNLQTLTVQNQAPVAFTATMNSFTDGRRSSTQALPGFSTYNNLVFWNYVDTSIGVASTNAGPADTQIGQRQEVLAILPVSTGLGGTASINQAGQIDVTILGTSGSKHSTLLKTFPASGSPQDPGSETVRLNTCGACSIIGPDEGLADVTAFVIGTISTNGDPHAAAHQSSVEDQLWATAVTTAGVPVAGTNPRVVSVHQKTPFLGGAGAGAGTGGPVTDYNIRDNVADTKLQINRDGTYVMIGYRQAQGTSIAENLGLMAQVYRTFRASVSTVGSAALVTPPTMDQRFPTGAPIQVNTIAGKEYTNQLTPLIGLWQGSPVIGFNFQGHIGYKCGFQGDATKMSILWAHADGTEDRAFIRQAVVTIGTTVTTNPTLAFTATESEFEASNPVLGTQVNNGGSGTTAISKASFKFLPGSFGVVAGGFPLASGGAAFNEPATNFSGGGGTGSPCSAFIAGKGGESCDAGFNAAGAGGDVLICFQKNVDNTTIDGNYFNQQVIANLYNGTALSDRAVISRAVNENVSNVLNFRTTFVSMVPVTGSASLTPPGHTPDGGIYLYMTCPTNDNGTDPAGLFARHFRPRVATSAPPTFLNNFFPAADNLAVTSAATPAFKDPLRLDRDLNASVTNVTVLTQGRKAAVLFTQENHLYLSITSDGESYTSTGGLPTPMLVDNTTSSNKPSNGGILSFVGKKSDATCGNLSGSLCFFQKNDLDQNVRYYVRAFN